MALAARCSCACACAYCAAAVLAPAGFAVVFFAAAGFFGIQNAASAALVSAGT